MTQRIERVLAIDPGKMTGLAWITRIGDQVHLTESLERDEDTIIDSIRPTIKTWKPELPGEYPLRIVMERFTITVETAKKSQAPFSLEVIGAVKQVCRDYGYPLEAIAWQKPGEAKETFPNPKLKRLDLWHVGGAGHALDAIRHGALYLLRSGWQDSRFVS